MAGALPTTKGVKDHKIWKGIFAVSGIMVTLVIYGVLQASKKALVPVAPIYKYCLISVSNILTTTCQYEAGTDVSPYSKGRESTVWGVSLMVGYLGFDGFTSTFQDKLFKGYDMEIHNQIFYTTSCSCILSLTGLLLQGHLLSAIDFVYRHSDCFLDIVLLSTVATVSQFFISYTIRTFGALTFAAVMTTRQLVSIMLSCVWFGHPLSWEQWIGAVIVFGSLYSKNFLKKASTNPPPLQLTQDGAPSPVKGIP